MEYEQQWDVDEVPHDQWTVDDVCQWLVDIGLPQYCETFRGNSITGKKLVLIRAADLPKMNIKLWDHVQLISRSIDEVTGRLREEINPTMTTVHLPQKSSRVLSSSST